MYALDAGAVDLEHHREMLEAARWILTSHALDLDRESLHGRTSLGEEVDDVDPRAGRQSAKERVRRGLSDLRVAVEPQTGRAVETRRVEQVVAGPHGADDIGRTM